MRVMQTVLRWVITALCVYLLSWNLAFVAVLAWEGGLDADLVPAIWRSYVGSYRYLWRTGGEFITYVQVLAILLTLLVLPTVLVWRTRATRQRSELP